MRRKFRPAHMIRTSNRNAGISARPYSIPNKVIGIRIFRNAGIILKPGLPASPQNKYKHAMSKVKGGIKEICPTECRNKQGARK